VEHLDETIINLRKEKNKSENTSIETGLYINDILTCFHEVEVLNEFKIMLPTDFITLSEVQAKIKYPSEQRPQIIKTNEETSVNIGFSLVTVDIPINDTNIKKEAEELRKILKQLNPAMEFYSLEVEQLEDFKLAWFDYKSFALDGKMYNIMFVAGVGENKMLHGIFNCKSGMHKDWQTAAIGMLKTIKLSN